MNGEVRALQWYDDGTGTSLFAAGAFQMASGQPASRIARWDGLSWNAVGSGVNATIYDMTVFDDGTGPALIVAGSFTQAGGVAAARIAKWDGTTWSTLDEGFNDTVRALVVFDDGTGPALYAGGDFTHSGNDLIRWMAKWDGENWSSIDGSPNAEVYAFEQFDDGAGNALYVGGRFSHADGQLVRRIARWDGEVWSPLGTGMGTNVVLPVRTLAVYDDGNGPALFAGGDFFSAGNIQAPYVARWDGHAWSRVGDAAISPVYMLRALDTPDGSFLFAGGTFSLEGSSRNRSLARWNGESWSVVGSGIGLYGRPNDMTMIEVEGDHQLLAAGTFTLADDQDVNRVARLENGSWQSLGPLGTHLNDFVSTLEVFDDGTGPALYAGGAFTRAGSRPAERIARWDGSQWQSIGDVHNGIVVGLLSYDDGNGPALYACGSFTGIGGVKADRIARWDGTQWSAVGGGFDKSVRCMTIFDDGGGPALYVGGSFRSINGVPVGHIARWNGEEWVDVGGGVKGFAVHTMTPFDDGSGVALYVGGAIAFAGNVPTTGLARWDGTSWSAVGDGVNQEVITLMVADLGDGEHLYVGGLFNQAGNEPARSVARWNGVRWEPLGAGLQWGVTSLMPFDDGTGIALYAGGFFQVSDGQSMSRIARWDGSTWSALPGGVGVSNVVYELQVHDDGSGPALFIGGEFQNSPMGDKYIAKYQGCGPTTLPAPLTDFSITLGTLLDGGLDELIDSDDSYLRARSQFGYSAEEPNVLELRVGAVSPNVDASAIAATIESRLNHPNGAASVRLRNWNTNEFDEVHVYTIGTTEIIETIEGIEASNYIRATDGRIELAHRQVVLATFSALGFDAAIDQVELAVTN